MAHAGSHTPTISADGIAECLAPSTSMLLTRGMLGAGAADLTVKEDVPVEFITHHRLQRTVLIRVSYHHMTKEMKISPPLRLRCDFAATSLRLSFGFRILTPPYGLGVEGVVAIFRI